MIFLQCLSNESVESKVMPRRVKESEIVTGESRTETEERPSAASLDNLCRVEKIIASDLDGFTASPLLQNQRLSVARQCSKFALSVAALEAVIVPYIRVSSAYC